MRHTASFLQTFHTAQTEASRYAAASAESEERAALEFINGGDSPMAAEARCLECGEFHKGGASCAPKLAPMTAPKPATPALRDREYMAEFNGFQVKLGGYGMLSEAQAKFLTSLLRDRDVPEALAESLKVRLEQGLSKAAASPTISNLKALPWKPKQAAAAPAAKSESAAPTEDGIYVDPATGRIFKLQFNKAQGGGSHLYAKQLSVGFYRLRPRTDGLAGPEQGEWEDHTTNLLALDYTGVELKANGKPYVENSWDYKRGLIREVKAEWRLTPEQAIAWGALYGSCVRCHRDLTKESSIRQMMGDTCASKQGF